MSAPGGASYLDAIFGALRTCARELLASQQWCARAERTNDVRWRFTFLQEAEVRRGAAARALAEVEAGLGPPAARRAEGAATPLEQLHENVAAMRERLATQERKLGAAAGELAAGRGERGARGVG